MKTTILRIILTGFCLFAAINPANACKQDEPVMFENIKQADTVIVAKILDMIVYVDGSKTAKWKEENPDEPPISIYHHAVIKPELREQLNGTLPKAPKVIELIVTGSISVDPKVSVKGLSKGNTYIFALFEEDVSWKWRYDDGNSKTELMAVMQPTCSAPYIFEATDAQIKAAKKVLAAE